MANLPESEILPLLKEALQRSANAQKQFDLFIEIDPAQSPGAAHSRIAESWQAFEDGVGQLRKLPSHFKYQPQVDAFFKQVAWMQTTHPKNFVASSNMDWSSLGLLNRYLSTLKQFKHLLHQLVYRSSKSLPNPHARNVLLAIHPYPRWMRFHVRYGWTGLLIAIVSGSLITLLCVTAVVAVYLWTPHEAPGIVMAYDHPQALSPTPRKKSIFSQASVQFTFPADGEFHTQTVVLPQDTPIERVLLAFQMRPNRLLELGSVELVSAQEEVIRSYDFRTFQLPEWELFHQVGSGEFQIQEKTLESLQSLMEDPRLLQQMAEQRQVSDIAYVKLSPEALTELRSLLGQTFESKKAFNQALQGLPIELNWGAIKLIRMLARMPIYRQRSGKDDLRLLSPPINRRPLYSDYLLTVEEVAPNVLAEALTKADIDLAMQYRDFQSMNRWLRQLENRYPKTSDFIQASLQSIPPVHAIRITLKMHYPRLK